MHESPCSERVQKDTTPVIVSSRQKELRFDC